ncbi:ABC transporter ATP-binding protein [Pilimelia columellifera]|uniref:Sn-glycerol-3-phosphate import ATP-binding protein UgpC n=1 Tax=Pilimelia columellifera subsp. columellifera TaxID=706583 RepID=A0ABN3NNV6_9ACTN
MTDLATADGVRLSGLKVAHGDVVALRGVDLTVRRGELLVVVGPSGAGKSTLLRAVAGLENPCAGTVHFGDREVTRVRPGERQVAMVFQSYALFPHLDVAANIAFGLRARGVRSAEARRLAAAAATVVGCGHLLARRPAQLSGGERQRVALARALVREPKVLLLDEPMSQLDPQLRVSMRAELRALHDRVGGTTIHVTHDQAEAMALADRLAVLNDGVVVQVGTPTQVWGAPATDFVARFVGALPMNLFPADAPWRPAGVRPPTGGQWGVRAEAVGLAPAGADDDGQAEVVRVEPMGADLHVHLRVGGNPLVARAPAGTVDGLTGRVTLRVDPAAVHLFDADGRRLP